MNNIKFANNKGRREENPALLTALKASARFLWVSRVTVLLVLGVLEALFVEGFFLCGSPAGGTCSLFCFFASLSKPSYRVSDILIGTGGENKRLELLLRLLWLLQQSDSSTQASEIRLLH